MTSFLIQSSPGNVISLPQLQHTSSFQVVHLEWVGNPWADTEVTFGIKLSHPFLLHVKTADVSGPLDAIIVKLNKAYKRLSNGTDLFELNEDSSIQVNVGFGEIYTNCNFLLPLKSEDPKSNLPPETFDCYNAKPGSETKEPANLRTPGKEYFTHTAHGVYTTTPVDSSDKIPDTIIWGFNPTFEESYTIPLCCSKFPENCPPTEVVEKLSSQLENNLNQGINAQLLGVHFKLKVDPLSMEILLETDSLWDKFQFSSTFTSNTHLDPTPPRSSQEWASLFGGQEKAIIPSLTNFIPQYQSPFTLRLDHGISNSAVLHNNFEKVVCLFQFNTEKRIQILSSSSHILENNPGILSLKVYDALGNYVPSNLLVYIALT